MKHIFYMMLAMLLCSCGNTATKSDNMFDDAPKRHGWGDALYGDVEKIITVQYDLTDHFGELKETPSQYSVTTFNENGDVVEEIDYDENGGEVWIREYEYDSTSGHIASHTSRSKKYDSFYKEVYTTDDEGNITSISKYDDDGCLASKTIMKYRDGKLAERNEYNKDGDLDEKIVYKDKDSSGRIRTIVYDASGDIKREYTNYEDERGNISRAEYRSETGDEADTAEYQYTYNADDRLSKVAIYRDDKLSMEWVFDEYDDKHNLLLGTIYEKESRMPTSRIKYEIYYRGQDNVDGPFAKEIEEKTQIYPLIKQGLGRNGVYEVGDYYNRDGKEGIVFEVSEDGRHGKIVSLDEEKLEWCTTGQYKKLDVVGASSSSDGEFNTNKVMSCTDGDQYPAFAWCRNKGAEWYLPSVDDLVTISSNRQKVDNVINEYGDGWLHASSYWSSTEADQKEACCVDMYNGSTNNEYKYRDNYVRAVSTF